MTAHDRRFEEAIRIWNGFPSMLMATWTSWHSTPLEFDAVVETTIRKIGLHSAGSPWSRCTVVYSGSREAACLLLERILSRIQDPVDSEIRTYGGELSILVVVNRERAIS